VTIPTILILLPRRRYAGEEVGLLGSRVMADRYRPIDSDLRKYVNLPTCPTFLRYRYGYLCDGGQVQADGAAATCTAQPRPVRRPPGQQQRALRGRLCLRLADELREIARRCLLRKQLGASYVWLQVLGAESVCGWGGSFSTK
jgi:hypothetical protein